MKKLISYLPSHSQSIANGTRIFVQQRDGRRLKWQAGICAYMHAIRLWYYGSYWTLGMMLDVGVGAMTYI
jgi:hypothetical protein